MLHINSSMAAITRLFSSNIASKTLNCFIQPCSSREPLCMSPYAIRCRRSLYSLVSLRCTRFSPLVRFQHPCGSRYVFTRSIPRYEAGGAVSAAAGDDNRVPATLITGFLGSGKTTLLNHILTAKHGRRIAVIENEFGEVDIDGSLVASHAAVAEDIIMVNNGCLCCTVRGDLVKMLLKLTREKRDKFDHIVIETTGLAKPAPVIETFFSDELVAEYVKLDGVVTLVDSKHSMQRLNEIKPRWVVNEAVEQVAYADRIILNKIDLVGETEIDALIKRVKHINAIAKIKQAKYGEVDVDFVLGVGGYDPDRIESEVQLGCHGSACQNAEEHRHHEGYHHQDHDSAVSSVTIVSEGKLDLGEVNDWLERVVDEKGENLYRLKGILHIEGSEERYVFQGVQSMLDITPGKQWGPEEEKINKLVFIGRNLDETALRKGFKGCLA
ncbi:uncharacterized protein [Aristolochia californica]|uniref:uncharacterized protein n=1 Tax=Aristolochia californica TaxID=171875 RepID=UPI0035D6D7F8